MATFGRLITVKGDKRLIKKLDRLPRTMQTRILRNATAKGAGIVKKAMQSAAPRRSGLLQRSMKVKRTKTKEKGDFSFRVQPGKGFRRVITRTKKGTLRVASKKKTEELLGQGTDKRNIANPQRYGHLTELEHKLVRRGRVYGNVPATHWMRNAFNAKQRVVLKTIRTKIAEQVVKAAKKG